MEKIVYTCVPSVTSMCARTTFHPAVGKAHALALYIELTDGQRRQPTAHARGIQKMVSFSVCRVKAHGLP